MARKARIPFRFPSEVPSSLAIVQADDLQAPDIQRGDEVAFVDEAPKNGDMVLIVMRPELVPEGRTQCLVMRLGMAIPPHVTFPYREPADAEIRMLLVVCQPNPAREFTLRCDQILAVRKFSHVQKRALPG